MIVSVSKKHLLRAIADSADAQWLYGKCATHCILLGAIADSVEAQWLYGKRARHCVLLGAIADSVEAVPLW